nr:Stp1/IreP family PP2C-type Ser/Thr phosphatase [uncultured Catonella sp.]
MKTFSETRAGINRSVNQDCFLCEEGAVGEFSNLFIVADGMGGHNGGDFASKFCIENVKDYIVKNSGDSIISIIRSAIKAANEGIRDKTKMDEELKGCGTTVVLSTIKDDILYIANVGDSRLYVFQNGKLSQITEDHSVVEEMIKSGLIKKEEARFNPHKNKVTRALGAEPEIEVDFFEVKLEKGARILMCSDGVSNMMDERNIEEIVGADKEVPEICKILIDTAVNNGGKDDATVVMIEV